MEGKSPTPHTDSGEGCWDPDGFYQDIVHDFGEVWRNPSECNRKTCTRDGTIIEEVCPEPVVPEGCVRIKGFSYEYQDFPYCCDRVACPGDDEYWEDSSEWPERCDDKYCVRDLGEEWSEHKYGICNRKKCARNKYNEAEIFEETCPEVEVPKGCKLEAYPDLTKEFPACCPKVVCPSGHPANKSGDSADDKTGTQITTDHSASGTIKRADDNGESANYDKNKVKNKKSGSETVNQGVAVDVANLIKTREESWNSSKRSNITEMLKSGAVVLFNNERKREENIEHLNTYQKDSEQTNKKEKRSKHKKKKEKQSKDDSANDNEKKKKRKRGKTKARRKRVEDTELVNESRDENKREKGEPQNKNETELKVRATEKVRRKRKSRKKLKPLGNIHENEVRRVKRSDKSKRNKTNKRKGKKEGEEDLWEKLSKIIKLPKTYIYFFHSPSHSRNY